MMACWRSADWHGACASTGGNASFCAVHQRDVCAPPRVLTALPLRLSLFLLSSTRKPTNTNQHAPTHPLTNTQQSQYVIQARDVTHLEAHATGVKEEWITPVIAFLRRHLGLATPEELVEPAAAVAGAHEGGQPKEGLEPAVQYVRSADPHSQATSGPGEKGQQEEPVAEVQFPSMD